MQRKVLDSVKDVTWLMRVSRRIMGQAQDVSVTQTTASRQFFGGGTVCLTTGPLRKRCSLPDISTSLLFSGAEENPRAHRGPSQSLLGSAICL